MDASTVHSLVCSKYTTVATQDLSTAVLYTAKVSTTIGYIDTELAYVPESANLGLVCGAPVAALALKPVCLPHTSQGSILTYPDDQLGSGPGLDALLAAGLVSPTGHVTGLDMSGSMLKLAGSNLVNAKEKKLDLTNVIFAHTVHFITAWGILFDPGVRLLYIT